MRVADLEPAHTDRIEARVHATDKKENGHPGVCEASVGVFLERSGNCTRTPDEAHQQMIAIPRFGIKCFLPLSPTSVSKVLT